MDAPMSLVRALTWNLFHGRDFPPDPALFTWRSRLLRVTERNATHAQVNRDLGAEFAAVLAAADWDVALLQECPPRWIDRLATACDAAPTRSPPRATRSPLCARPRPAQPRPDRLQRGRLEPHPRPRRRSPSAASSSSAPGPHPERRAMAFTRAQLLDVTAGRERRTRICVANLHASAGRALAELAEQEVTAAAERATEWAGEAPLLLGGDLNLRPRDSDLFERLADRFGLAAPTGPGAIDHLLARGLESSHRPASGRPSGGRSATANSPCGSPTTPRSRPTSAEIRSQSEIHFVTRRARREIVPPRQRPHPTGPFAWAPDWRRQMATRSGGSKSTRKAASRPAAKRASSTAKRSTAKAKSKTKAKAKTATKRAGSTSRSRGASTRKSTSRRAGSAKRSAPSSRRRPAAGRSDKSVKAFRDALERNVTRLARPPPGGRRRRRQARPDDARRRERARLEPRQPRPQGHRRPDGAISRSCSTRRARTSTRAPRAPVAAPGRPPGGSDARPVTPPTARSPRPTSCAAAPAAPGRRSPATTSSPRAGQVPG